MTTHDFKIGDTVWYNDGQRERLSGTVHRILTAAELDFYEDHYLIMVSTHIGDYLIVRPKSLTFATKEKDRLEYERVYREVKELFNDKNP